MEYNTTGAFYKTENVKDGQKVKLTGECVKAESRFKDEEGNAKTENQVKARFQGHDSDVSLRLNWTTVYGLAEAFGKESKDWIGRTLTAMVKDATTGQSLYLIPEGSELVRDENKRWTIKRGAETTSDGKEMPSFDKLPEDINPEDIPF